MRMWKGISFSLGVLFLCVFQPRSRCYRSGSAVVTLFSFFLSRNRSKLLVVDLAPLRALARECFRRLANRLGKEKCRELRWERHLLCGKTCLPPNRTNVFWCDPVL